MAHVPQRGLVYERVQKLYTSITIQSDKNHLALTTWLRVDLRHLDQTGCSGRDGYRTKEQ